MATFIIYIIKWAVSLTLLYSLFGLFLKRETLHSVNRVVLLVILLASMVLPVVQLETKAPNYVTRGREMLESGIILEERLIKKDGDYWATDAEAEYNRNISRITNTPVSNDKPLHDTENWNWTKTLLLLIEIYAFGLVVTWLRYLWSLGMLIRLIRQGKCVKLEGLPRYVHVIVHPKIKTPCSWMRWIILNPSEISLPSSVGDTNESPSAAASGANSLIITHELAHIRLGHSWDMLLCELTCRMLWCVPFAWMLRQDLRDVHEYQADRRVLQNGIEENEYQLLLIRKATGTGLQPVVNALNQSPIKRRFKMMYTKPSRRWVALKAAYLLPLSALALMAFARPQALGEIEETVEKEVTKYVADVTSNNDEPAMTEQAEPIVQPTVVEAKDTVITGSVSNQNGQPLQYANLVELDEFQRIVGHAVTDMNGKFSFKVVNPKHKIRISYVGFKSKTLDISSSEMSVTLEPNTQFTDVKVVGITDSIDLESPRYKERTTSDEDEKVFNLVEQAPIFPGGQMEILNYLNSHLNYPSVAKEMRVEANVVVRFTIDKTGFVRSPQVINVTSESPLVTDETMKAAKDGDVEAAETSRNYYDAVEAMKEEAIHVVRNMPRWEPGRQNGRRIETTYTLSISFKMK